MSSRHARTGASPGLLSGLTVVTSRVPGNLSTGAPSFQEVRGAVTLLHNPGIFSHKVFLGNTEFPSLKAVEVLITVMIRSHLDLNKGGIYCLSFWWNMKKIKMSVWRLTWYNSKRIICKLNTLSKKSWYNKFSLINSLLNPLNSYLIHIPCNKKSGYYIKMSWHGPYKLFLQHSESIYFIGWAKKITQGLIH